MVLARARVSSCGSELAGSRYASCDIHATLTEPSGKGRDMMSASMRLAAALPLLAAAW